MKGDTKRVRAALHLRLETELRNGHKEVEINAGKLHREFGGYPAAKGRHIMPIVSAVMRKEFSTGRGDRLVYEPPRGKGATLTFIYALPR